MAMRIEDYAIIGDCRTAALVGRDGSIDWLCVPRFDSGACFAALLGNEKNGRWKIAPGDGAEIKEVRRRYRPDSLVLETEFVTATGVVRVTDAMAIDTPTPAVVRLVEGVEGEVKVESRIAVRFDYGWIVPWVQRVDGSTTAIAGPDMLRLRGGVEHQGRDMESVAEFTVTPGKVVPFLLVYHASHEPEPSPTDPVEAVRKADDWWRAWAKPGRDQLNGDHDRVLRSLITLKALTYAPTGGIVAAVTTSLPEKIGGVRNWDYRFCWLRDATFTLLAFISAGYLDEAGAWREWLLRAVAGLPDHLQIMYGVAGERRLTEMEVGWLDGYEGSKPVRAGNAASEQFQLDVYGEIFDALHQAHKHGLAPLDDAWRMGQALIDFVSHAWKEPDEGIWEVRGGRRHFTHSKVMAWVVFDRSVKAVEDYGLPIEPGRLDDWKKTREEIREEVCREGFDAKLNSFVQSYGSDALDASLLMIPLVGFLPADDPKMVGTVEAIQRRLVDRGFVKRYDSEENVDGLPPGEGVFLPCSFWLADNLALQGKRDEAVALFERLVSVANDVGLLAEEYDLDAGRQLGNFPQAFSHVCLVNTARHLARDERGPHCRRGEVEE